MMRILFHGTNVKAFNQIKKYGFNLRKDKYSEFCYFGQGIYLTDDRKIAAYFAKRSLMGRTNLTWGNNPYIIRVKINISNQLIYVVETGEQFKKIEKQSKILFPNELGSNSIMMYIKKLGYKAIDSLQYWNIAGFCVFSNNDIEII